MEKRLILVVEDEALIRLGTMQFLEDAGFSILGAYNADVAIDILESRNGIRAVISDIKMPGSLDGMRLVHVIQSHWLGILLIVASGQKVPTEAEFAATGTFIPKPYEPKTVLAALDELFGPNPG